MKNQNGNAMIFLIVGLLVLLLMGFLFLTPWGEDILVELGIIRRYGFGGNETSAISGLRTLCSVEAVWWGQDPDRNGLKDYWTYDVSAFSRMFRADGTTQVNLIDRPFAKADASPHPDDTFGKDYSQDWTGMTTTAKTGYYFRAMLWDESGHPYNQNEVGDKKVNPALLAHQKSGVKAANNEKFAFVAYPAIYALTGVRTYIVSQGGTIYAIDSGSDKDKIILRWPGADPTLVSGPGGQNWHIAD